MKGRKSQDKEKRRPQIKGPRDPRLVPPATCQAAHLCCLSLFPLHPLILRIHLYPFPPCLGLLFSHGLALHSSAFYTGFLISYFKTLALWDKSQFLLLLQNLWYLWAFGWSKQCPEGKCLSCVSSITQSLILWVFTGLAVTSNCILSLLVLNCVCVCWG